MRETMEIGPMLREVMTAQRTDEEATAYPRLETYCAALVALCEDLDAPIVWPVGPAAERLAGGAVLLSEGRVRLHGWSSRLDGERVLLLTVAAVTPIDLLAAARHAKAVGARDVRACGVAVQAIEGSEIGGVLDGYAPLEQVLTSSGGPASLAVA